MNENNELNQVLSSEIQKIEDLITQELCQVAVQAAKDAMERGQSQVDEFISQRLDHELPRIMRGR